MRFYKRARAAVHRRGRQHGAGGAAGECELAAARITILAPSQLLKRLKDRFKLLAGARGAAKSTPRKLRLRRRTRSLPQMAPDPTQSWVTRSPSFAARSRDGSFRDASSLHRPRSGRYGRAFIS